MASQLWLLSLGLVCFCSETRSSGTHPISPDGNIDMAEPAKSGDLHLRHQGHPHIRSYSPAHLVDAQAPSSTRPAAAPRPSRDLTSRAFQPHLICLYRSMYGMFGRKSWLGRPLKYNVCSKVGGKAPRQKFGLQKSQQLGQHLGQNMKIITCPKI
jgi:hypothetical protein